MSDPRSHSQVSVRTVLTVCLTTLAVAACVYFLHETQLALTLTVGAILLALAINHAVEALTRRHWKRGLAIAAVMVGLLGIWVALILLIVPPAISQGRGLVEEGPALWEKLQKTRAFVALDERFNLHDQLARSSGAAKGAVAPVLSAIGSILSAVAAAITLTVLTILMLIFGPDAATWALDELVGEDRPRIERVLLRIYHAVGGYIGGLLGICTINAVLTGIFLGIARMPFFLPLAILSGLSSLVPYAGPLVIGVSVTLLALVSAGVGKAAACVIYFLAYGQLEGNVLGPVIYRRTAHVNPLLTFLAILFLAEFLGLAGAVVAVPLAAAGQIVVHELLEARKERTAKTLGSGSAQES